MVTRHFIVTLLIVLVEFRVAKFETVEIKLGNRNVIIPLQGPVHVKRIKPEELENFKINIPDLVELVAKVQGRSPVGKPPPRPRLPPDRKPTRYQPLHPQPMNVFFPEQQVPHYAEAEGENSSPIHSQHELLVNTYFPQQKYHSAPEYYPIPNHRRVHPEQNIHDEIQHSLIKTVTTTPKSYSKSNTQNMRSTTFHSGRYTTAPDIETKGVNGFYNHDKVITKPYKQILNPHEMHYVAHKITHDSNQYQASRPSDKHHELTPNISKWIHDHELLPHIEAEKPDVHHETLPLTLSSPRLQHTDADITHEARNVIPQDTKLKNSPSIHKQEGVNLKPKLLLNGSKHTEPLPTVYMTGELSESDASNSSTISEKVHTEPSLEKTTTSPVNSRDFVLSKNKILKETKLSTSTHSTYTFEIPDLDTTPKIIAQLNTAGTEEKLNGDLDPLSLKTSNLESDLTTLSSVDIDSITPVTTQRHTTRIDYEDYVTEIPTTVFVTTTEAQQKSTIINTYPTAVATNEPTVSYQSDGDSLASFEATSDLLLESIVFESVTESSSVPPLENITTPIITSIIFPYAGYERITNATQVSTSVSSNDLYSPTTMVTTQSYVTDSVTEVSTSPFDVDDASYNSQKSSTHTNIDKLTANSVKELFSTEPNIDILVEHTTRHDATTIEQENISAENLSHQFEAKNDSRMNKPTGIAIQHSMPGVPVKDDTSVIVQDGISTEHLTQSPSTTTVSETTRPHTQIHSQEIADDFILITTESTLIPTTFVHEYHKEINTNVISDSTSTHRPDENSTTVTHSQDLSTEHLTTYNPQYDKHETQDMQTDNENHETKSYDSRESYVRSSASKTSIPPFEEGSIGNAEIVQTHGVFSPNVFPTEYTVSPSTTRLPEEITESSTAIMYTAEGEALSTPPVNTAKLSPVDAVKKRRCKHRRKKTRDSSGTPAANGKRRRRRRRKRPSTLPSIILTTHSPSPEPS